jgi:AraC-like DNA-binding protein
MPYGFEPLLRRHRIFCSNDTEEARTFLQSKEFRLERAPRQARELDMCINGVYLPGMYVGYIQYGPPVDVRAVQREDYWVQLPIRGQMEVVSGADRVICDSSRAAVASPTRHDYYLVRSGGGCAGIRLCLHKAHLIGQLAALLGEPPDSPLEFAPEMDITQGHGHTLARWLLMAVHDFEASGSILRNPIVIRDFEQFMATCLLLSHPHNFSAGLDRLETSVTPRNVRRAIDYIDAHLDQAITIADIVKATGVPGRTLFTHFKEFKGVSPMRYVRNARLQQAREALLQAEPEESVTAIAASWGFAHLGRFSIEYRRRFGESPSETLKRRPRKARLCRKQS